jgi:hypothetical protein
LIVDHDKLGKDGIVSTIENAHYPNRCLSPHVMAIYERDIGEWTDDNPLNKLSTHRQEYLKLFPVE